MKSIKKLLLVLAILACSTQGAYSQGFSRGSSIVDLGLSLGWGFSPQVRYEYGLTDKIGPGRIGVGAVVGMSFFSAQSYRYGVLLFGPQANYHLDLAGITRDLDLYFGLGVYFGTLATGEYISGYSFGPYVGWHLGFRYWFSPKVGGFLQVGATGGTGVAFGLSFNL